MNPILETGALIGATIVVGITLLLIPVPKQKPPEFDKPPVEAPPPPVPPTPQEVLAPNSTTVIAVIPPTPEQETQDHLAAIETKLMHIQQQVQRMEKKVD